MLCLLPPESTDLLLPCCNWVQGSARTTAAILGGFARLYLHTHTHTYLLQQEPFAHLSANITTEASTTLPQSRLPLLFGKRLGRGGGAYPNDSEQRAGLRSQIRKNEALEDLHSPCRVFNGWSWMLWRNSLNNFAFASRLFFLSLRGPDFTWTAKSRETDLTLHY